MDIPYSDPPSFSLDVHGHSLTFYPGGPERLDALIAMIEGAHRTLKLCFYIYSGDRSGALLRDALTKAARRGVDVTLIVDRFGSNVQASFFAPLKQAGGTALFFSPRLSAAFLIRNHQKMVIADGTTAMLGGFNVADDYFARPEDDGWQDLGMAISGPCVGQLETWFNELHGWTADSQSNLLAMRRLVRDWDPGDGPMQLLIGGPTKFLSNWARKVSRDLGKAWRMDMVMGYFSPAPLILRKIGRIGRGGNARLLLPSKSDNGATIGASRLLYKPLIKRGVKIWEFLPVKLHTKLIVIDNVVYIGSGNFDVRSLYLNLEVMLRIEDAALAERMRVYVTEQLPASQRITQSVDRAHRTWYNRIRWGLSWFLVTVVDYSITRRLNLGLGSVYVPENDEDEDYDEGYSSS